MTTKNVGRYGLISPEGTKSPGLRIAIFQQGIMDKMICLRISAVVGHTFRNFTEQKKNYHLNTDKHKVTKLLLCQEF